MDIRDNRAYVHYNGWGTRWDEWITLDSDRIIEFRTHTIQSAVSNYLSPNPTTSPDSFNNISLTNTEYLAKVPEKMGGLVEQMLEMQNKLINMKKLYAKRMIKQKEML